MYNCKSWVIAVRLGRTLKFDPVVRDLLMMKGQMRLLTNL